MKIATRTKLSAFLNIRRTIPHTHTHTHTHTHAQSKDHRVDGSINDHRSNYKKSHKIIWKTKPKHTHQYVNEPSSLLKVFQIRALRKSKLYVVKRQSETKWF